MIAVLYQGGVVVGMSESEKHEVWSYLRYSKYMFGRLAGPGDRIPPSVVESILHVIDTNLRLNLSQRVGIRYVQASQRLAADNGTNLGIYTGNRVLPGINLHIALSLRVVQMFRGWQFDAARATEALRRRLKRETFPDPSVWLTFVSALRGTPVNTFSAYPELATTYTASRWNESFPRLFPTLVSLEKWGTAAGEILQCFATARRVPVATVGKLLRVKI